MQQYHASGIESPLASKLPNLNTNLTILVLQVYKTIGETIYSPTLLLPRPNCPDNGCGCRRDLATMERSIVQRIASIVTSPNNSTLSEPVNSYRRQNPSQLTDPQGKGTQHQLLQPPQQQTSRGEGTHPAANRSIISGGESFHVGEETLGVTGTPSGSTADEGGGDGGGQFSVTFESTTRDVQQGKDCTNPLAGGVAGLISIVSEDTNSNSRIPMTARDSKCVGNNDSGSGSCEIIDVGDGQNVPVHGGRNVANDEPTLKRHRSDAMHISLQIPNMPAVVAETTSTLVTNTVPIVQHWRWHGLPSGSESGGGDDSFAGETSREAISLSPADAGTSPEGVPGAGFIAGPSFLRERRGRPPGSKRSRPAVACIEAGCKRPPTYGTPGDDRAAYCAGHGKLRGLQNIVTPRCRHRFVGNQRCPLWPAFGRETDKSPTYCAQHALQGMKNINNPKCKSVGCERWPSFGILGTKTALYCGGHKMEGMVDVVKPRCREGGCLHRPSFGWRFEKVPSYCRAHKADGMIDVANPRCTYPDCIRRPSFGVDGQRASRCSAHKVDGMVDVVKPRCRQSGCQRIAYYKVKGTKGATRCSQHQEEGMVRKN